MPSANDLAEILIFIGLVPKEKRELALEKAKIILKQVKIGGVGHWRPRETARVHWYRFRRETREWLIH
jgi:hypothetical protein